MVTMYICYIIVYSLFTIFPNFQTCKLILTVWQAGFRLGMKNWKGESQRGGIAARQEFCLPQRETRQRQANRSRRRRQSSEGPGVRVSPWPTSGASLSVRLMPVNVIGGAW